MGSGESVCCDCGEEPGDCYDCHKQTCGCDGERHPETGDFRCNACEQAESRYWLGEWNAYGRAEVAARRDLDLPVDASDAEVMEAARGLK